MQVQFLEKKLQENIPTLTIFVLHLDKQKWIFLRHEIVLNILVIIWNRTHLRY